MMVHSSWNILLSLLVLTAGLAAASKEIRPPRLTDPIIENGRFHFGCVIEREGGDESTYQVTFLTNDVNLEFSSGDLVYPENEARLPSFALVGHMGKSLSCRVTRVQNGDIAALVQSPVSNSYWLGLRGTVRREHQASLNKTLAMRSRLYLYSTVPILCHDGVEACELDLEIHQKRDEANDIQPRTLFYSLDEEDWHVSTRMFNNEKSIQVEFPEQLDVKLNLPGRRYDVDLWHKYNPTNIIYTFDDDINIVTSPHITTFDGFSYDVLVAGIFRMMDDRPNNVFVQSVMQMHESGSMVTCAVAMKSGVNFNSEGTRGGTIIIDMCSGVMNLLRCQLETVNELVINGNSYQITSEDSTFSTTFVDQSTFGDISINNILNVESLIGLCGDSDGDSTNDLGGLTLEQFLESHRLPGGESLFDCPAYYPVSLESIPPPPPSCEATDVTTKTFDQHSYTSTDQGIFNMVYDIYDNRFVEVNRTASGICGVAVQSGTDITSEGHRGEIILIDKCQGTLSIMKCQTEQGKFVVTNAAGVYTITTVDGAMEVQVRDMGVYLDVVIGDIWNNPPISPLGGLCGNNDDTPDNEFKNLDEFMESNRVDLNIARIKCSAYYPAYTTGQLCQGTNL